MKDKYFIDTNILVYANDRSDREKQERAKTIILQGIADESVAASTQVLSEFFVTVTQKIKIPLSTEIAKKQIWLLKNIEIVDLDFHSVVQAIRILQNYRLSYWDALIVASAQTAKCTVLYSEDLNPGQKIESVLIVNPFH